jgi:hypothetical protein
MKAQKVTICFTALNVLILLMTLFRATTAAAPDIAPVLCCRELYLIDDKGRVRAELKVTPPQPNLKMPDGSVGFPVITSIGGPHVKLGANEDGGGLVLGGDGGYVQILSRGTNAPFVKIVTKDGREQVMKPQ